MVAVDAMQVAELVSAALAGNVAAFGELVDRFQPMARRYATSLLQDAGPNESRHPSIRRRVAGRF